MCMVCNKCQRRRRVDNMNSLQGPFVWASESGKALRIQICTQVPGLLHSTVCMVYRGGCLEVNCPSA